MFFYFVPFTIQIKQYPITLTEIMIAGCSLKKALFFGHFGRRYEWLTLVPHRDFGD